MNPKYLTQKHWTYFSRIPTRFTVIKASFYLKPSLYSKFYTILVTAQLDQMQHQMSKKKWKQRHEIFQTLEKKNSGKTTSFFFLSEIKVPVCTALNGMHTGTEETCCEPKHLNLIDLCASREIQRNSGF